MSAKKISKTPKAPTAAKAASSTTSLFQKLFENSNNLSVICFLLLIICAAFSLSYPLSIRTANGEQLFISSQSYAIIATAHESLTNILEPQGLLFSQSHISAPFSFAKILYGILMLIIPLWILPALLSLIVISLLWIALRKFTAPLSTKFIAVCMFAFTPLFVSSQLALGTQVFLFIAIILLLLALNSHVHPILCALLAAITCLFGPDILFAILLILVFARPLKGFAPLQEQKKYTIIGSIIGLCAWLILAILTHISWQTLVSIQTPDHFFVEFGAAQGQTVLLFILAIIGIVISWKQERRWNIVSSIALIAWSFFFPATSLLATAIISFFAATAFVRILGSKWQHQSLKIIVLATILISVLTSYFIYTDQIIQSPPAAQDLAAYAFLAQNTPANAIILASPQQGGFISYFSGRSTFITDDPTNGVFAARGRVVNSIFDSHELSATMQMLRNQNVTYILVDPQLEVSNEWREDQGGLALLLHNKVAFTLVYEKNYQIYRVNTNVSAADFI